MLHLASILLILLNWLPTSNGFVSDRYLEAQRKTRTFSESPSSSRMVEISDDLGLTPELAKITQAFEAIGDDKLRYKQLLYMATQLAPMDKASMIPENKVIGCLSTVYVDCEVVGENRLIKFTGDSDGLLTKGLVSLLVRGLSGNTAEQIQKVDPSFIQKAGIQSSLTPGRNSGFLNMLATMKKKARLRDAQARSEAMVRETQTQSETLSVDGEIQSDRPIYDAIIRALEKLRPSSLELRDESHRHAGHAGMNGVEAIESHFELDVVAEAFEGLNLVKRHQLIYMLLGEIMPKIHALQITARTPSEVESTAR